MLTVLKIGGSLLRGHDSYATVARFLHARLTARANERLVIVVSASFGVTDALEAEAVAIAGVPNPVALDLLWSTGETRSVAVLSLHLQRLGVAAAILNVHQAGFCVPDGPGSPPQCAAVRPDQVHAALAHARAVIVPGFLAIRADGTIASLGRGGSDLTAVLAAQALGARACELIKDVAGYYTADPRTQPDAAHIDHLSIDAALEMADGGCELVQAAALHAARRGALPLVIRGLDINGPVTHVQPRSAYGVRDQNDSCRAAVGA